MRLKLFLTIFIILNITVFSVMVTNFYFFSQQRLQFVDENLKNYVRLIAKFNVDQQFKIAPPILTMNQDSPVQRVIVGVFSLDGKTYFANQEALETHEKIKHALGFSSIEEKNDIIRIYSEKFEKDNQEVMLGLRIPMTFAKLTDRFMAAFWYLLSIVIVLSLLSLFLTKILLLPLQRVANYLSELSQDVDQLQTAHDVAFNANTHVETTSRFPDEFKSLVENLSKFIESLRSNFRLSKRSTLLLAHELKTPMTILRNTLEKMKQGEMTGVHVHEAITEVERLDKIIAEFMDWTILNNNYSDQKNLHAIKLKKSILEIIERHNSLGNAIITYNLEDNESTIFANPIHLELLINNIISNGLKYSGRKPLAIKLAKGFLEIEDQGPGIPKDVLSNLGKPFNAAKFQDIPKGTGLGLAWISTICKRYEWQLKIDCGTTGTTVSIDFNERDSR